jgi:hypothetical protein
MTGVVTAARLKDEELTQFTYWVTDCFILARALYHYWRHGPLSTDIKHSWDSSSGAISSTRLNHVNINAVSHLPCSFHHIGIGLYRIAYLFFDFSYVET